MARNSDLRPLLLLLLMAAFAFHPRLVEGNISDKPADLDAIANATIGPWLLILNGSCPTTTIPQRFICATAPFLERVCCRAGPIMTDAQLKTFVLCEQIALSRTTINLRRACIRELYPNVTMTDADGRDNAFAVTRHELCHMSSVSLFGHG